MRTTCMGLGVGLQAGMNHGLQSIDLKRVALNSVFALKHLLGNEPAFVMLINCIRTDAK